MAKISDVFIRNLKPTEEVQKVQIGEGLSLWVRPSGKKIWYLRYYVGAKRQIATIGEYPALSLKDAQRKADDLKAVAKEEGVNISKDAKKQRQIKADAALADQQENQKTFRAVAESWLDKKASVWVAGHLKRRKEKLEGYLFPALGNKSVESITMQDVDAIIRPFIRDGKIETAKRTCDLLRNVLEHADLMELLENGSITSKISKYRKEIPTPPRQSFYQEMTQDQIGTLLHLIEGSKMRWTKATSVAVRLAQYVALRASELCGAKWTEIDLEKAEWVVPAARMKAKRDHIVPLSTQAVELLKEIQVFTGGGLFVFPSQSKPNRPITTSAILQVFRRLGYGSTRKSEKESFVTHAFRGMFSTTMYQNSEFASVLKSEWIEHQLAHIEPNKVKAAYNQIGPRSYLDERRVMLQKYADYLDNLKKQAASS